MARPILLSNGQLHVGLNKYGLVHDFYFPYVGLENHTAAKGLRHRIGVWVDEAFSWLDDGSWNTTCHYYENVLVSKIVAESESLGVKLEFDDCVDSDNNVFIRNIHIVNLRDESRQVRLFLHQVFVISDSHMSDTVQFEPDLNCIVTYKGHRTFMINASHSDGRPFDDYSVGLFGIEGHDGTFKDAEDGQLSKNGVEHGKVDSVLGLHAEVAAHSSHRVYYLIAAGKSAREAKKLNQAVLENGPLHHILSTSRFWSDWSKPAVKVAAHLPEKYRQPFVRSALLIKAQTDKHGAVIASTDTTMLNYMRDSYAYAWPRDGAYALWPLMRLGYTSELINFFSFCRRSLHDDGYLSHKYQADGALGSSWHPYTHGNQPASAPIQTDETALPLFLFGQYYRLHPENELLVGFYPTLVKPMANFLASFVGEDKLPLPSYDLWEQKYLTSTYTAAVTYGALLEAVHLAEAAGDKESAVRWQSAAEDMYEARDIFYNQETGYFHKGVFRGAKNHEYSYDGTIDSSSLFGAFMYGYFELEDDRVKTSYKTLREKLCQNEVAIVRYPEDDYYRSNAALANPWPVTSLWYAQYALEIGDEAYATAILDWVTSLMTESGVLAEQYDPFTKEPRSVSPLTWSQAEYMSALLDMISEETHHV